MKIGIQSTTRGQESFPARSNNNKAAGNDRVAPTPLSLKGVKAEGPNKTDIVISNNDAAQLLSMAENMNFLRQCKVMILVD